MKTWEVFIDSLKLVYYIILCLKFDDKCKPSFTCVQSLLFPVYKPSPRVQSLPFHVYKPAYPSVQSIHFPVYKAFLFLCTNLPFPEYKVFLSMCTSLPFPKCKVFFSLCTSFPSLSAFLPSTLPSFPVQTFLPLSAILFHVVHDFFPCLHIPFSVYITLSFPACKP